MSIWIIVGLVVTSLIMGVAAILVLSAAVRSSQMSHYRGEDDETQD